MQSQIRQLVIFRLPCILSFFFVETPMQGSSRCLDFHMLECYLRLAGCKAACALYGSDRINNHAFRYIHSLILPCVYAMFSPVTLLLLHNERVLWCSGSTLGVGENQYSAQRPLNLPSSQLHPAAGGSTGPSEIHLPFHLATSSNHR